MDKVPVRLLAGAFLLVVLCSMCACSSTEHLVLDDPEKATKAAACPPLPTCLIPRAATSTQLESALWTCVLEYRALYSVCYHMSRRAEVGK